MKRRQKSTKNIYIPCVCILTVLMLIGIAYCPDTTHTEKTPYKDQVVEEPVIETQCNYYTYDVVYDPAPEPIEKELEVTEKEPAIPYTEEDLDLFARLLTAEMGCTWIPDEIQLYTGSVVLNRMKHEWYPDTLYDVIYDSGQYSPTWTGSIHNTPDERTIANAKKLLEEGSILPDNVIFQAGFKQGDGVYYQYYDETLGTTTYFCYSN